MDDFKLCPNCGEPNINTHSGYCPNCGYAYKISQFEAESIQRRILADYSNDDYSSFIADAGPNDFGDWFLKREYITASIGENNLIHYLKNFFNEKDVERIAALYRVETHTKDEFKDAAIFYQYDKEESQIAFKVMKYDQDGHRITGEKRNPKKETDLVYQKSLIDTGEYCFFGRHLLNRDGADGKPICIVESEKSAIIAALAYPEAIWMAAGSCYFLTHKKLDKDFNDREIILFPDIDVKFEPIDIDEKDGFARCINWYVIKDRPYNKGISWRIRRVTVSGFLDSYIKTKCEKCSHREYCSNSIWYNPGRQQAPYIIENREREFDLQAGDETRLNTTGEKKTIPKIVLETKDNKEKMKKCLYRGWDIGDYIIHSKERGEPLVPFNKLIEKIDQVSLDSIKQKILRIEESIQLSNWITAINNKICQPPSPQ